MSQDEYDQDGKISNDDGQGTFQDSQACHLNGYDIYYQNSQNGHQHGDHKSYQNEAVYKKIDKNYYHLAKWQVF